MFLHSIRVSLMAFAAALILTACGGGSSSKPQAPAGGITVVAADSEVTITWQETPGVEYWIFASPNSPNLTLSNWLATVGSTYRLKVTSPYVVTGLTNGTPYSFFLTGRINGGPGSDATPTVIATPRLAGIEWTSGTTLNTGNKTAMAYGGIVDSATNTFVYRYIAAGNGGRLYNASNIDSWTSLTSPVTNDLYAAEFALAKFIAVGAGGKVVTSGDGQTWGEVSSLTTQNLNAIASSGSAVVAVGDNGSIITSTDGVTWKLATSVPTAAHLYAVNFSNAGKWVAVGAGGTILSSTDGFTWTAQTSNTVADLKGIGSNSTYTNSATTYNFVAIGAAGTVLTSPDAITWTQQTINTNASLNALSYVNQFMAVGSNGTIITSPDGITWTTRTSNSTENLTTLIRASNQYIAVSDTGKIIYSK
jgi:photosystem II stability/assembly factor-like uncharacterized protein